MTACPSAVVTIFMNSSPAMRAANVVPSGCVRPMMPDFACLAYAVAARTESNMMSMILLMFRNLANSLYLCKRIAN